MVLLCPGSELISCRVYRIVNVLLSSVAEVFDTKTKDQIFRLANFSTKFLSLMKKQDTTDDSPERRSVTPKKKQSSSDKINLLNLSDLKKMLSLRKEEESSQEAEDLNSGEVPVTSVGWARETKEVLEPRGRSLDLPDRIDAMKGPFIKVGETANPPSTKTLEEVATEVKEAVQEKPKGKRTRATNDTKKKKQRIEIPKENSQISINLLIPLREILQDVSS